MSEFPFEHVFTEPISNRRNPVPNKFGERCIEALPSLYLSRIFMDHVIMSADLTQLVASQLVINSKNQLSSDVQVQRLRDWDDAFEIDLIDNVRDVIIGMKKAIIHGKIITREDHRLLSLPRPELLGACLVDLERSGILAVQEMAFRRTSQLYGDASTLMYVSTDFKPILQILYPEMFV